MENGIYIICHFFNFRLSFGKKIESFLVRVAQRLCPSFCVCQARMSYDTLAYLVLVLASRIGRKMAIKPWLFYQSIISF